jgi:2-C-methyl-D-erythritol 4-phosphate cytidylyltransferase
MTKYAIIVAGGSGSRMQSTTPKQFIEIGGLPILMRTISAFYQYSQEIKIILVIPGSLFSTWATLVKTHGFSIPLKLVKGAPSRSESVKNGLQEIKEEGLVAIHDGVRPFVTSRIIDQCYKSAHKYGSGVAVVLPKDSIRQITDFGNIGLDRSQFRLMQTPQVFSSSIIKLAYASTNKTDFTDDAGVAEDNGNKIHLIEGDYRNIKITTPEDLKIAQALIESEGDFPN